MIEPTRRTLLAAASLAAAAPAAVRAAASADLDALARDEVYWARVAGFYDRPKGMIQLEAGQFGSMPRPVLMAYEQKLQRVNSEGTLYTRSPAFFADMTALREKVAALLGVGADEIAFTRGGTESMQVLIGGYNKLKPGDAVLYADLDYDSMQVAMEWLATRRGVKVIKIALPEPATRQNVVDAYEAAFKANPNVRLALITHLSHRTGLIPPVREIAAVARAHNVDLLLDGGHALGQAEFSLPDLGLDFVGLNLHKWIQAPLGVGVVYIRRERLPDIDPSMFEPASAKTIDARSHTGTVNNAAVLAVSDAVAFHQSIGLAAKARRLRYLRDLWAERVRANPAVEVLTPNDPTMHAGITSFRIKGKGSEAEVLGLKKALYDRRLFTVERFGPAKGACIRVSPSFVNTPADLDRLVAAINDLARG